MFLEIHDAEIGNTLMGAAHSLDFDYQAEQWVIDITTDQPEAVLCLLFDRSDATTPRRAWSRTSARDRASRRRIA